MASSRLHGLWRSQAIESHTLDAAVMDLQPRARYDVGEGRARRPRHARARREAAHRLLRSAYGSVRGAVEAMRGAADYIEKPDDERLVAILARRSSLARTANERALATENKRLRLFVPTLVAGLRDAAVLEPIDRAGGV